MARYTVELRKVVDSGTNLFDFPYSFYDEAKKPEFEQMFINHFYFREIGQETVGRFKHYLKVKFRERLPLYNELIKLTLLEYDVLKPYNLTETLAKTSSSSRTSTGETEQTGHTSSSMTANGNSERGSNSTRNEEKTAEVVADNRKVGSDTPNGLLSMTDIKGNVYASKAEIEDSKNTVNDNSSQIAEENSSESTSNTTSGSDTMNGNVNTAQNEVSENSESYTLTKKGHIGVETASELLRKHTELLKIIQTTYTQFFDECEDLFMGIF